MRIPQVVQHVEYSATDVFDPEDFARNLAADSDHLKVFRDALKKGTAALESLFHRGLSAAYLVVERARLIDQLLHHAWSLYVPGNIEGLALVAVGGYGRAELHPGSDVDIMVLVGSDSVLSAQGKRIEAFLTGLWDLGLEVGQSVRSVEDCVREAAANVTVVTNLMEARLIVGSADLYRQMKDATGPKHIWPDREFFEAKRAEQAHRHERFHDTAYNLEPNVKEGPGGLRDIQTIGWVAKRHFDAETLHELVSLGFLTKSECQELIRGQNYLWRVRFALHTIAGRREDRLLFDYQCELAGLFGYVDEHSNLAVEQFMQRYYRTIKDLSVLNEILLQYLDEAILLDDAQPDPQPLNKRFQIRRGFIELTNDDVFHKQPFALLELFLLLAQRSDIKGVRAATIRSIRQHTHIIDQGFRADLRCRSLFMEILRQPDGVTRVLRRMNAYGVLGAYLPEFGQIVGRMQYDLFHSYTVDQHILFVVRNLRRFDLERFRHEFPHCSVLMRQVPKPELLHLAGLYHDIAKGRGGDHSILGALDAKDFCERHAVGRFDTRMVCWLVEHHLLMSVTAQKQDITDPEVINRFASRVGDQLHLKHLYLLTVADIRGTNPKLWNAWRESLLRELYEETRRALRRGVEDSVDHEERTREIRNQALALLASKSIDERRVAAVWDDFPSEYFRRHSADEIAWHTRAVLKKAADGKTLVLARREPGGTKIFIYRSDSDGLFAATTSIFDQLSLNIVDARIITARSGYSLDTYIVLEADGAPIADRQRLRQILERLQRALNKHDVSPEKSTRRPSRRLKSFRIPTEVAFSEDVANGRTVVEIITADRPGLLSQIGNTFIESGLRVQNAKIATLGERAEDVFFVTDLDNRPLDAIAREPLRQALANRLDAYGTDPPA